MPGGEYRASVSGDGVSPRQVKRWLSAVLELDRLSSEGVQELVLVGFSVDGRILHDLRKFRSLQKLRIDFCEFTSSDIRQIQRIHGLRCLDYRWCEFTNEHAEGIAKCSELRSLEIWRRWQNSETGQFDSEGMRSIASMENLESLRFFSNGLDRPMMESLAESHSLTEIFISSSSLSESMVEVLPNIKQLKKLTLNGKEIETLPQ
ncbi:hypothetical protein Pla8534_44640 [Lignipirellula cremea]|uniref:F-box/LRR-repeat protein 15/At3g58940/PEG3-like LRR domain-containing protein n=2 Tax=Lignipirellula cremea TaxID=2528010 RepID=A0A518DXR7_9BACT|nr:hypothetical protein Pla8534_44640 [Lignipirellula cremea]